ncbi:Rod binding domain-containing protein [Sulfitobacter undariae]|uniref:Rod binding domain-containing protein n=1 Tax=Sulfitobacter undariae TaxID=1563671 RepID=A0A7W6E9I1_9RHOB|nr:rod-binding protein [Sulfitobacter undariae]MBB3994198.1 Rod binding domain-containing protein [Sulfitobacter undariae]
MILTSNAPPTSVQSNLSRDAKLMDAARNLEAAFLAEMLKSGGLGQSREGFGGGTGEDQFSSFLVQEQASLIVQGGGIGLAQSLFDAMKEHEYDA